MAFGVVARNNLGQVLSGLNRRLQGYNVADLKAYAILEGVELAIEKGWQRIEVESDARVLIEQIKGQVTHWRLEVVCDNINTLANRINNVKWMTISRSSNENSNGIVNHTRLGVCLDNCVMEPHPNIRFC